MEALEMKRCMFCDGKGREAGFGRSSMSIARVGTESRLAVKCLSGTVALLPVSYCPICGRFLGWRESDGDVLPGEGR